MAEPKTHSSVEAWCSFGDLVEYLVSRSDAGRTFMAVTDADLNALQTARTEGLPHLAEYARAIETELAAREDRVARTELPREEKEELKGWTFARLEITAKCAAGDISARGRPRGYGPMEGVPAEHWTGSGLDMRNGRLFPDPRSAELDWSELHFLVSPDLLSRLWPEVPTETATKAATQAAYQKIQKDADDLWTKDPTQTKREVACALAGNMSAGRIERILRVPPEVRNRRQNRDRRKPSA